MSTPTLKKIRCRVCPDKWLGYDTAKSTPVLVHCLTCKQHTAIGAPPAGKVYQDCNSCRKLLTSSQGANRIRCPGCSNEQQLCVIRFACLQCNQKLIHHNVKTRIACSKCKTVHQVNEGHYIAYQKKLVGLNKLAFGLSILLMLGSITGGALMLWGLGEYNTAAEQLPDGSEYGIDPTSFWIIVILTCLLDAAALWLAHRGHVTRVIYRGLRRLPSLVYLVIVWRDQIADLDSVIGCAKCHVGINLLGIGIWLLFGCQLCGVLISIYLAVSTHYTNRARVVVNRVDESGGLLPPPPATTAVLLPPPPYTTTGALQQPLISNMV